MQALRLARPLLLLRRCRNGPWPLQPRFMANQGGRDGDGDGGRRRGRSRYGFPPSSLGQPKGGGDTDYNDLFKVENEEGEREKLPKERESNEGEFLDQYMQGGGGAEGASDKEFLSRFVYGGNEDGVGAKNDGIEEEAASEWPRRRPFTASVKPSRGEEEEAYGGDVEDGGGDEEPPENSGKKAPQSKSIYAGKIAPHHDDTLRRIRGKKPKRKKTSTSSLASDSQDPSNKEEEELYQQQQQQQERDEEYDSLVNTARADKERRMSLKRQEEDSEDMAEPMTFPRIILATEKEEMWALHKENPTEYSVDKLAEKYRICKARVHAILWLWDLRKEAGEPSRTPEEEDREYRTHIFFNSDNEDLTEEIRKDETIKDIYVTPWSTKPNYRIMPPDWEGSVRSEQEVMEEAFAKEEKMCLEEFEQRMKFNKLQMAGLIKNNKYSRRRPPEGWSYVIEELGESGKRGKHGARRFVADSLGVRRPLNDLEKVFLQRETVRPRRRIGP